MTTENILLGQRLGLRVRPRCAPRNSRDESALILAAAAAPIIGTLTRLTSAGDPGRGSSFIAGTRRSVPGSFDDAFADHHANPTQERLFTPNQPTPIAASEARAAADIR